MESKYQEALDRLCENNYFDEKGNCNCDLIVMDRILLQEEKYALLIKEHIQEEINKIDSDIEISIYGNDIDRIYVTYKEFKFEFTYYYSITSRKLCFRGYEKPILMVILMTDIQEKNRRNVREHMVMCVRY